MIKLESFYHLHEAQMLVDELADAQIAAHVSSERRGASGALPFTQAFCEVWLESDADLERAREFLKEYVSRSKEKESTTVDCPRCSQENPGNFGLCWSCGNELPSSTVSDGPYREVASDEQERSSEPQKKTARRKKKPVEVPRLTQRVVPSGRTTMARSLWTASALIPGSLLWMQGNEVGAVLLGVATATVLWFLSGSKAPDYCRSCHAPMVGYSGKCEECGRKVESEITESRYASEGGQVPKAGMRDAIVVAFAAVVLLGACVIALATAEENRGGMRRYYPAPTKPF